MRKRSRLNRLIWDNEDLLDQLDLILRKHLLDRPKNRWSSWHRSPAKKEWYLKLQQLKNNHKTVKSTIEHLKK